jgi:hypothetical protein
MEILTDPFVSILSSIIVHLAARDHTKFKQKAKNKKTSRAGYVYDPSIADDGNEVTCQLRSVTGVNDTEHLDVASIAYQ